jgi:hypothetical protein
MKGRSPRGWVRCLSCIPLVGSLQLGTSLAQLPGEAGDILSILSSCFSSKLCFWPPTQSLFSLGLIQVKSRRAVTVIPTKAIPKVRPLLQVQLAKELSGELNNSAKP